MRGQKVMINSSEQLHCGSLWMLWGQNPSLAQGCHLLVDLSCSSDNVFYGSGEEKEKRHRRLYFISIISCLNKSSRLLPIKKRQTAQTRELEGIWDFDREKYSREQKSNAVLIVWLWKWNQQSANSHTKGFLRGWTPKSDKVHVYEPENCLVSQQQQQQQNQKSHYQSMKHSHCHPESLHTRAKTQTELWQVTY